MPQPAQRSFTTAAAIRGDQAYVKSEAALRIARELPRWQWTWVFHFIPRVIRDAIYDLVARCSVRLGFRQTSRQLLHLSQRRKTAHWDRSHSLFLGMTATTNQGLWSSRCSIND
jgi:predicted DCC family thiol-disulfide oxidoreductase YuxK